MRQNVGLLFLSCGSIILSLSVFRIYLIKFLNFYDWKNIPWESRLALRMLGIKNREVYLKWVIKAKDKMPLGLELNDLTVHERIVLNLPVIALVLMVAGFFLCFNYSALISFASSLF